LCIHRILSSLGNMILEWSIFSLLVVFLGECISVLVQIFNLSKVKKWSEQISLSLWILTSRNSSDGFLFAMN
jgi:hypothetical protein